MLSVSRVTARLSGVIVRSVSGGHGEGAGRGGGSGGSIRDAGGAFGKMEAAREDEYFYKKQKAQLQELREHIEQEVEHHKGQLENHQKVLERHQQRISEIEAQERALGKE
uniref:ATPase inhibitor, mitochondrial n=1 Tax=Caenorhabditis japonica TaxID=281687 RepID=A0A8R1DZS9_CAEJA